MIRPNTRFDKFIRRSALAGLLALATSATVAQAQVFSPAKNLSNNTGNSSFPQTAVDPAGNINVVWSEFDPQTFIADVFFSRSSDGGVTFSTPKKLSSSAPCVFNCSVLPKIAVDTNGNINVVWVSVGGSQFVFFTRSSDGGATFSTPRNLFSNSVAALGQPQIALDSSGNINIVSVGEPLGTSVTDIFFTRSTDGGATFSTLKNISNNPGSLGFSRFPQIAVDSSGRINVVWAGLLFFVPIDIFFSRSTDGGTTFSAPKLISDTTGGEDPNISSVQIAVDSSGNIDVIWLGEVFPFPSPIQENIFFAHSRDGGATFSAPKNLSNSAGLSLSPQMAVDSSNINVVWWDNRNGGVFFGRSNDGGTTFSAPKSLSDILGSTPQIAVDSSGRINVVWSQGGFPSNIFYSRSIDGGVSFSAPQSLSQNLSSAGCSFRPSVALASAGNINVVWDGSDPCSVNDIFFAGATAPPPPPPTWTQKCVVSGPQAGYYPAMAYDTAHAQSVLFGGTFSDFSPSNETWTWNGSTWTKQSPATIPPARVAPAMAYDAARGQVVMFGGASASGFLNDTWVWDGVNWTQKASGPGPRLHVGMAYDAARQQVVLFGGSVGTPTPLGDTWVWDGASWTQKFPSATPGLRSNYRLAYDAARQQVVLFGGFNGSAYVNETWVWDGTTWTQKFPVANPSPRSDFGITYDANRQRVVLFSGNVGNPPVIPDNATWEWDGSNWTQDSPATSPIGRGGLAMAYDAARSEAVMFGGVDTHVFTDTWVLGAPASTTCPIGPPPTIVSVSPSSGTQGQTITNFTVNGNNFQPTSTISFSGTGITVSSYISRTANQIVASVAITNAALTGLRDVSVANPDGQQATKSGAFTVVAAIIGQPAITVSPSPINFPPTPLARTSAPTVVTITNPGTATLSISNITTQSPFALVGPLPTSVPAGGQATFSVTLSAKGPAPFSGTITIASNAPTSPTTVPLSGTVVIPEMRFDPVPNLLNGPAVTTDTNLLATQGRVVQGVAADGVTQIVLRIPAFAREQLAVTLLNDQNNPSLSTNDDGVIGQPGDDLFRVGPSTLLVPAVGTTPDATYAFAIYRAPTDFVRTGVGFSSGVPCPLSPPLFFPPADCTGKQRSVFVRVRSLDSPSFDFKIEIKILRPPVVLVHGLWESPSDWNSFAPLVCGSLANIDCASDAIASGPRFAIRPVHYNIPITVTASIPSYSKDVLNTARANALGFDSVFVKQPVKIQIKGFLNLLFKQGLNPSSIQVAATQADVVAHSMGGNVIRSMTLDPDFLSPDTFGKGLVHKLITIGTPHLGTPLATQLLDDRNNCVRDQLAAKAGLISFEFAAVRANNVNTIVHGGVGSLSGAGTLQGKLIGALQALNQSNVSLPTAFVAGVMSGSQLAAVDNDGGGVCPSSLFQGGGSTAFKLRCGCGTLAGNPLAKNLTSTGWPTIVTQSSDAIVPQTSQYNGLTGIQQTAIHSSGPVTLGFGLPHEYQGESDIPSNHIPLRVIEFLNTPVTRGDIFLKK